jgi:hypothetical protein
MSPFDDYVDEMPADEPDDVIASFRAGVRAAATRMPEPSPTLAHMLHSGVSSNSTGSLRPKRSITMRVKAYVAGLGVAAKVMLGTGVAVAAATATAVGPIDIPRPDKHQTVEATDDGNDIDRRDEKKTTDDHHKPVLVDATTTTAKAFVAPEPKPLTTTTAKPYVAPKDKPITTTTAKPYVEPDDKPTTTTTVKVPPPEVRHDITLTCEPNADPVKVICWWNATESAEHRYYKLMRSNVDGSDWQKLYKTEDHREFADTTSLAGHSYKYFVYSLRDDGAVVAESNAVVINCCA